MVVMRDVAIAKSEFVAEEKAVTKVQDYQVGPSGSSDLACDTLGVRWVRCHRWNIVSMVVVRPVQGEGEQECLLYWNANDKKVTIEQKRRAYSLMR